MSKSRKNNFDWKEFSRQHSASMDALEKEFHEGMLDLIVYGIEIYDVSGKTPKHVPVGKYFTCE